MSPVPRSVARVAIVTGVVTMLGIAALATRADEHAAGGSATLTGRDVGVGLAFGLAAIAATGPMRQRLWIASVGLAWLAGSLLLPALSLHQAVLAVVLLAAPTGTVRGWLRLTLALLGSVLVAGEVLPQPAIAGYFLVVAGVVWVFAQRREASTVFACCAGILVSLVLAFGWWVVPRGTSASTVLAAYEAILALVALGLSAATWLDAKGHARLADRVLGGRTIAGLEGLRQVLASALRDGDLTVELVDPAGTDSPPGDTSPGSRGTSLPVRDGEDVVAVVTTRSAALADVPTAVAVAAAVRLTVANLRLNQAQARQASEVQDSRVRLLAAVDRERQRVAALLRDDAGAHLERALVGLGAADCAGAPGMSDLKHLVKTEIAAASAEVERIVAGVPPTALGSGRLRSAITALAARSPVPVTLELADDAVADAAIETALFYVCSEALTNIAKHSGATHGAIRLMCASGELVLVINDNGQGGANGEGSGLGGLRDRMATFGGSLAVRSSPGGGTVIAAAVPIREV